MNDYTKGILTGASLILCFFMLGCPDNQSQDFGHIKVKSITVLNNEGQTSVKIESRGNGSGIIRTLDDYGTKASLGSENGNGIVVTYGANDKQSTGLGGDPNALGIYGKTGKLAAFFGEVEGEGWAFLNDGYGDQGWIETGKK